MDRFEQFKARAAEQIAYRDAYNELAARDPEAARKLIHPDAGGPGFDYKAELEKLQGGAGTLRMDPAVDLKT